MKRFSIVVCMVVLVVATLATSLTVFATEDNNWRQEIVKKWSGIPDMPWDRRARVLTITVVYEDGRIEGNFWGPTLGENPGLSLSPESKALVSKNGKEVKLDLKVTEGLAIDLDLTYNIRKKSLFGYLIPRMGSVNGMHFYIFFIEEK